MSQNTDSMLDVLLKAVEKKIGKPARVKMSVDSDRIWIRCGNKHLQLDKTDLEAMKRIGVAAWVESRVR